MRGRGRGWRPAEAHRWEREREGEEREASRGIEKEEAGRDRRRVRGRRPGKNTTLSTRFTLAPTSIISPYVVMLAARGLSSLKCSTNIFRLPTATYKFMWAKLGGA